MLLQNRWPVLLLVVLLTATACGGSGDEGADAQASQESSAASGPADVPEVVAEVNGEEILKEDFVRIYEARQQQAAAQPQGGQQPDEEQLREEVVQGLVNEALLTQEADRRGIEASEEQVQQTLTEQAQQNGLESADAFVSALEEQGLDREEIDSQASLQTRFDLLVTDEAGTVEASEKEVKALYAQVKQQQAAAGKGGQEVPPLSKVRSQLVSQVESQERSQTAQELIDALRKDADITVNL